MKNSENEFGTEHKINKYHLPEECERHVSAYHYWAEQAAEAKSDLNDLETALKLIIAQTEIKLRTKWNDVKYGKQTDAAVKAAIEINTEVMTTKQEICAMQRRVNILAAEVYTMEHRKAELDNLVTLFIKGFYAAPHGGKQETPTDEIQRKLNKNLNHKRHTED
jgi:hypothetical protein